MSSINQNGAPSSKTTIALKLWTFNLVSDTFGVIVDGYREHDDTGQTLGNWSTTTIKKVSGHGKTIETTSGSMYKLVGDADKIQLKKNGFPDSLIQLFIHGFPQNWEPVLREYWEKRKSTNPLNANNWFDHKMAAEIKRKSLGIKMHDKTRQSRVGTTQETGPKPAFSPDSPLPPTPTSQKEPVRRSPRTTTADAFTVPATPSTAANITSNSMQAKKKEDNEPTPRFVPQTDGRSNRRRSASNVNSTPLKANTRKTDVIVPDVQEIKSTPGRRSQSVARQNPTPQTPTSRANNSAGRITRSQSVQRELPPAVRSTPRRSASRAPSQTPTPANKRSRSVAPSPAKSTPTPKRGRPSKVGDNNEAEEMSIEQPEIRDLSKSKGGNQEIADESPFKAPLSTTKITPRQRFATAPIVTNRPKATTLFQWHLKFMPEMAGKSGDLPPFILIGHQTIEGQPVDEAQLWHTTLIMRVTEGDSPEDWSFHTTRSEYKLSGKICIREMVPLGFTQDFVRAFLHGFPGNYKKLLWTAFNDLKQGSDVTMASSNNSTRPKQPEPLPEVEDMEIEPENSTMSSRGRSLRKTSPPPIVMPRLNVEKDRRQRVQPKKRTVNYSSSSSSDNEAVLRTLRDVHYDDDIFRKPSKKKRRTMETNENYVGTELIRKIVQKKRKLQKQIEVLDEKMQEIFQQMGEKLARQERINALKARDREERIVKEKKPKKKVDNYARRAQVALYTSSSDSDLSSDSSDEDEDSTETEVTDDGGEWERTPKYQRNKPRITKKKPTHQKKRSAPKEDEPNLFEDINNEYSDGEMVERPKKIKKRTWRQIDLDRLKHAINVIKVNSEEDWEKISKTVGSDFTPEDCKDVAIKKLHWKPPQIKEKRPESEEQLVIKAREGTQAYGIQLNEKHREYMLGAGSQGGDCFREQVPEEDDEMAMTNVADLDESILAALRTPTMAEMPPKRRAGPLIAAPVEEEDTPQATRKSLAAFEEQQNTAQRESHQRYLHQITNNRSFFNLSRNNNTANISKLGTSRAAENIGKKMDRIKKNAHAHRRKADSDFEEEEEGLID